jgi:hypothetical protein
VLHEPDPHPVRALLDDPARLRRTVVLLTDESARRRGATCAASTRSGTGCPLLRLHLTDRTRGVRQLLAAADMLRH